MIALPVGVHITLQYNVSGNIEKVYTGFKDERKDVTDTLMPTLLKNNTVPAKIHITKGTSWVYGVLYTAELFAEPGNLPGCVESKLLDTYLNNSVQFNFFAANMNSTAADFKGPTPIRQCLTIAKFKILPGWLVPSNISDAVLYDWLHKDSFPFNPDVVSDYVVFRKGDIFNLSAGLKQFIVNKVKKYTDVNGYVKGTIYKTDKESISVDYSDIVTYNIQPNSLVIMNSNNEIVYTQATDNKKRDKRSNVLSCSYCGKSFNVPKTGYVQCTDIHCSSRLVPRLKQFMSVVKLPPVPDDVLSAYISSKDITCIPDLLLIEDYKDIKLEITLAQLLRSLVPVSLISRDDIFVYFANACNNNAKTFRYYIHHPDMIESDLGIKHIDLNKLFAWLMDGYNLSDLTTLLDSHQFILKNAEQKFEGAPIFRGNTIYITGEFVHGTTSDIISILNSYSAKVVTQFSDNVDWVVIGDTQDSIDGKSLNAARALGISIATESQFFNHYGIDDDLKLNLVYKQ